MLVFLVERRRLADFVELAVDADAREAVLLPLRELLLILALAAAHDGSEQIGARTLGQLHHAVDHLADRLRRNRFPRRGRIGDADARPKQTHIVVDFGDGRDGRAGVSARRLLLDADRRRKPVDMLDIGLLHHLEKLAGIGREALDIAPLALGIDGVEGERRFAAARQAGDDDQRVARQVDVDALEVVFARTANRNMGETHGRDLFQICSDSARAVCARSPHR
ncbi:hypothetical protein FG95_02957 [Sphingopyxis sp. LC363]|nr:hypothetical protein FG95_02957 [Sphingopyxis sp. LC363]